MKNNEICPKCNSREILRIPGSPYAHGNNIKSAFSTVFSTVSVVRYLCCDCGFTEEWIDYKEDIEKLIEMVTR